MPNCKPIRVKWMHPWVCAKQNCTPKKKKRIFMGVQLFKYTKNNIKIAVSRSSNGSRRSPRRSPCPAFYGGSPGGWKTPPPQCPRKELRNQKHSSQDPLLFITSSQSPVQWCAPPKPQPRRSHTATGRRPRPICRPSLVLLQQWQPHKEYTAG